MPFDRTDPRHETRDDLAAAAPVPQDEDDLAAQLGTLFQMFGGEVLEPARRD